MLYIKHLRLNSNTFLGENQLIDIHFWPRATTCAVSVSLLLIAVSHTAAGCGAVADYSGADHEAIFTTSISKPVLMQVIYSVSISAQSPWQHSPISLTISSIIFGALCSGD